MRKDMIRLQASDLPSSPTPCPTASCVYNEDGFCDDPRINKGNGDAECHGVSNKALLRRLGLLFE